MATLRSLDGETFNVDEAVVLQSPTIQGMFEDGLAGNIRDVNVTGIILAKVIEYCKKHADNGATEDELRAWDTEFVKVDQAVLYDLIVAADYLKIKSLLDLTCQTVADRLKGKNPDEMRKILGAENDYTPEGEEEVRRENPWAFE